MRGEPVFKRVSENMVILDGITRRRMRRALYAWAFDSILRKRRMPLKRVGVP